MRRRSRHGAAAGAPGGRVAFRLDLSRSEMLHLVLARHGVSISSVARQLGVTRPAVSGVINGHWRSLRIEAYIARLLDVPVEALFGPRELSGDSVARRNHRVNPQGLRRGFRVFNRRAGTGRGPGS